MFFLKELPSTDMVEGYTGSLRSAETVVDALTMMRQASLLLRELEAYFAQNGLSQLKFLILIVIDRDLSADSLRQKEIAQRIDVSKPVLHRTVQTMKQTGLLSGQPDPNDKRAEVLSLTDLAKQKLQHLLPEYFSMIESFMSRAKSGGQ